MKSVWIIFLSLLTGMSIATAETLTLSNGDKLDVTNIRVVDGVTYAKHPVLGELRLTQAQLQPPAAKITTAQTPSKPDPSAWKHQLKLGLSGASGNSRNQHWKLGVESKRKSQRTLEEIRASYARSSDQGLLSEHRGHIDGLKEWHQSEQRSFVFMQSRLDLDEFEDWDYRLSLTGGYGYTFVDTPPWLIKGKAGLGLQYSDVPAPQESLSPEAVAALTAQWTPQQGHELSLSTQWFPNLEEQGEYRALNRAEWQWKPISSSAMALSLALEHDYDSQASGAIRENDWRYALSLVIQPE